MKHWLLLLSLLTLAACSTAPKKTAPAASTSMPSTHAAKPTAAARCSKTYAPAQEDLSKRGDYKAGGLYAPHVPDTTPDYVPDVNCIAEPVVVALPRSTIGNRSPYSVLGKQYKVLDRVDDYLEQGTASYYGNKFHGRLTSNREVYDMYAFTAAHKSLPLPSFARVTNLDNGTSVVVRVNDRGPFHEGRVIDLSYAAAVKLDITARGTGRVEVRALVPGESAVQLATSASPASAPRAPVTTTIATGVPTRIATDKPTPMDELVGTLPPAVLLAVSASPQPATAPAATSTSQPWRYQVTPELEKKPDADEFAAWMQSRGVRVATGKPGRPEPATSTAVPSAVATTIRTTTGSPAANTNNVSGAAPAVPGADLQLQVASFASRDNADRALARLTAAGIDRASLSDTESNGRRLWRLRVGAADVDSASQLASRIASLGFGQPQVVRE